MLFKVRGIDVKQVYTHSVCSREYTFLGSSNDRGFFSVILVDFSSYFSVYFFLFSFFSLFFTVFLVRGFFPSFAYRVGCDHLHSSVLWTTRNPQPLSTDCNNLFYLSLVFFPSLPHYISFSFHFIACFSLLCLRSSLFYFFPLYDSPLFYVALSRVSSLRYEFFFHSVYSFKTITDEISLRTNSPSILQMYTYIFDMRYSFVSTYLDKSHSPLFTRGNFVKTYCQVISCYQNRLAV